MYKGKISYVASNERGFGFIAIPGREKQLFFHARELKGVSFADLTIDDEVTIEKIGHHDEKGDFAVGVSLAY